MADRPVRVLLVDGDEDSFELIKALLEVADGPRVELDRAATLEDARGAIARREHDAYLVHDRTESSGVRRTCVGGAPLTAFGYRPAHALPLTPGPSNRARLF